MSLPLFRSPRGALHHAHQRRPVGLKRRLVVLPRPMMKLRRSAAYQHGATRHAIIRFGNQWQGVSFGMSPRGALHHTHQRRPVGLKKQWFSLKEILGNNFRMAPLDIDWHYRIGNEKHQVIILSVPYYLGCPYFRLSLQEARVLDDSPA